LIRHLKNYFSLVAFSHTVFALPFAVIGFFLGIHQSGFQFDPMLLLKVVLCMIFARTSAMAFNRYADRMIDEKNERTKGREIPAGVISPVAALSLVVFSSFFFVLTTYTINPLCFYLSPVALLVILGYSFTKRFTWFCHLVLGLGLSLAPIGAYIAVTGKFDWLPLFFSFAVICWVSGFDIIYALQDVEFDQANQLYSLPSFLGKSRALNLSSFLHLLSGSFIIVAGVFAHFSFVYWTGAVIFISLLVYQHSLVKPSDLSKVNRAFFTTNGIASILFACFVVTELLLKSFWKGL
jgi:4-hydroxybenzoate polyprenyltransferase